MENTFESGKIMQLHGLSAAQYNGCIVDVGEFDENSMRYSCEVILGDLKGKKLAVKMSNLIEVPRPSPSVIDFAISKFLKISSEFESLQTNRSESGSMQNSQVDKIIREMEQLLLLVPNCACLWRLLHLMCKHY